MLANLEVYFPKPCDEPWDATAPRGCNRHCASCDTIAHDPAALTFEEAGALLLNEDEVCVRAKVDRDGVAAAQAGRPEHRATDGYVGRRVARTGDVSLPDRAGGERTSLLDHRQVRLDGFLLLG